MHTGIRPSDSDALAERPKHKPAVPTRFPRSMRSDDTLAEWLRRRPAKPMGSPRVGSNPTGVAVGTPCLAGGLKPNRIYSTKTPGHSALARRIQIPAAENPLAGATRDQTGAARISQESSQRRIAEDSVLCPLGRPAVPSSNNADIPRPSENAVRLARVDLTTFSTWD